MSRLLEFYSHQQRHVKKNICDDYSIQIENLILVSLLAHLIIPNGDPLDRLCVPYTHERFKDSYFLFQK